MYYTTFLHNATSCIRCSVAFIFCAFRWASLATLAACSGRFIILSYIGLYNNISNRCSQQLVFARSYIKKRKIGHSFRSIGLPAQRGTNNGHNHTPLPRDYRATASSVQISHFPPKQIIEHSNQNNKQKFIHFPFHIV